MTPEMVAESELLDALRRVPGLSGVPEKDLAWFAARCTSVRLDAGEAYVEEDCPAEDLFIVLKGQISARREKVPSDQRSFIAEEGAVTGILPFSRMTTYPLTARAVQPTWIASFPREHFAELIRVSPVMVERLVWVMMDRVRDRTFLEQQQEKLVALGKLSASLAHELNNPGSAVQRASQEMGVALRTLLDANVQLDERGLTTEQRRYLACAERETVERLGSRGGLSPLERSDREEEIVRWLDGKDLSSLRNMAEPLVEMDWSLADLDDLASRFAAADLPCVLSRLTATVSVGWLLQEIQTAATRVSTLIETLRQYSYLDQAAEQEVDLHQGLDTTLSLLSNRLSNGITVVREYDPALPRVPCHARAVNQVWTNLIENALDAMQGSGELRIRSEKERSMALVEIIDNGPGVPEAIRSRLFEPFFTTKKMGEGLGLGLDTVYRIVRQHNGQVTFESRPGETKFQVRLPLQRVYAI